MQHRAEQSDQDDRRDATLWWKAQQLKASPLFVGTIDAAPLVEKQAIFLALAGLKPVSEASSGHWVPTRAGRRSAFDNPAAVGALLDSVGLVYRLRHDEHATDALVSLQPELLDVYQAASAANDQLTIGELFGYPKTAVAAFASGEGNADGHHPVLPLAEQERLERGAGLLPMFRFSREDWRLEMAVEQRWLSVLALYELLKA